MITLHIETPQGDTRAITVEPEGSLMEAIREAGFEALPAACGGCCSCATCHVVIEPASFAKLALASSDEGDLLDGSDSREESSRLSCQVPLSSELDGMKLRIALMD